MSMLKTLALAAVLAGAVANASAETRIFDHYTVTYDATTGLGPITGSGSDSTGLEWFSFNLLQSDGSPRYITGTPSNTINIPSVTITANAGYSLSNLNFYYTGDYHPVGTTEFIFGDSYYIDLHFDGIATNYRSQPSFTTRAGSVVLSGYSSGVETGFRFTVSAVPEPEGYAMMIAGLGAVGFMGRRRKAG